VAEHSLSAAREHRREPVRFVAQGEVSERIHAAIQAPQRAALHAAVDGRCRDAEPEQLRPSEDAMLRLGQPHHASGKLLLHMSG